MKNTNMATLFSSSFASFIVLIATNAPVVAATEFKVGDAEGWRLPAENNTAVYSQWAAKNRFLVGDSLSFEYTNDSVLIVDKFSYYHCNTSNPISVFDNGKSIINLDKPGPFYFISGALDHCKGGQRLLVDVISPQPISDSPPSIAFPPQSYWPISPSPSPLSSSGLVVSVSLISVFFALIATIVVVVFSV